MSSCLDEGEGAGSPSVLLPKPQRGGPCNEPHHSQGLSACPHCFLQARGEQAGLRVAGSWGSDPCGHYLWEGAALLKEQPWPGSDGHHEPYRAGWAWPLAFQAPADLHSWASVRTTAMGTGSRHLMQRPRNHTPLESPTQTEIQTQTETRARMTGSRACVQRWEHGAHLCSGPGPEPDSVRLLVLGEGRHGGCPDAPHSPHGTMEEKRGWVPSGVPRIPTCFLTFVSPDLLPCGCQWAQGDHLGNRV